MNELLDKEVNFVGGILGLCLLFRTVADLLKSLLFSNFPLISKKNNWTALFMYPIVL